MLSQSRVQELLDYASSYGHFDESTPDGTPCAHGGTPMNQARRSTIIAYKIVLGLLHPDFNSVSVVPMATRNRS